MGSFPHALVENKEEELEEPRSSSPAAKRPRVEDASKEDRLLGGLRFGQPLFDLEEQRLLQSLLPQLEDVCRSHSGGASHVMLQGFGVSAPQECPALGGNGGFPDPVTAERLLAIARNQVQALENRPTCLLSVRILLSPPGAPAQSWHLDYAGPGYEGVKARTVFVALTPATADNCTEFLHFRSPSARHAFDQKLLGTSSGVRCIGIPEEAVDVQSVLMDKFDVAWLETSRTIHRRGPNTSAFTRATLNVDYSLETEERLRVIGFVDDDMRTAQACPFQAVGPSVVDDLHSEVVVELE